MAKYICNYDEVKNIVSNIKTISENMNTALSSYKESMNNYLSNWQGEAAQSFKSLNEQKISSILGQIENISFFAEYLESIADKIKSLEEELSKVTI